MSCSRRHHPGWRCTLVAQPKVTINGTGSSKSRPHGSRLKNHRAWDSHPPILVNKVRIHAGEPVVPGRTLRPAISLKGKAAFMPGPRRWPTDLCKQPVSMAIDTAHHRLFSGCRSGLMAVSDYPAGKIVATIPIGSGVYGAGYDPSSGDAFASNADGKLTVIHQDGPGYHRTPKMKAATIEKFFGARFCPTENIGNASIREHK
jgi:hypothetical protein